MKIIDAHIHMFDIYTGKPIGKPLKRIPVGLITVLEALGFRRPGGQQRQSSRWLGDWVFVESCRRVQVCEPDVYYEYMDANGVAAAVVAPIAPMVRTEQVLDVSGRYGRLIPFACVDFAAADRLQDLHRYMRAGCLGLKIHPVLQGIRPTAPEVRELLAEYEPYGLPVCLHAGPCRAGIVATEAETYAMPAELAPLIRDFPKINFILAHMGLQCYDEVITLASTHENVFLETSFQPVDVLRKAEAALGAERIVFGTDFPLLNPAAVLKTVRRAFAGDERKLERIFAGNISRLLRLPE